MALVVAGCYAVPVRCTGEVTGDGPAAGYIHPAARAGGALLPLLALAFESPGKYTKAMEPEIVCRPSALKHGATEAVGGTYEDYD